MANTSKWTYKKYMGDDRYSWAVFRDGKVFCSGLARAEAKIIKEKYEREENKQRLLPVTRHAHVWKDDDSTTCSRCGAIRWSVQEDRACSVR